MNEHLTLSMQEPIQFPRTFQTATPFGLQAVKRTPAGVPARELQRAWFAMTRQRPWRTLAVVPAAQGFSCLGIAHGLAAMAAHEAHGRALLVNISDCPDGVANTDDEGSRRRSASAPAPWRGPEPGSYRVLDFTQQGLNESEVALGCLPGLLQTSAGGFSVFARVVVAVSSPLERPTSLAVVQAADAVVVCVEIGTTDFDSAHDTLEAVGADSLVGCIAVKPWDPR